jgi:hypothetical protein
MEKNKNDKAHQTMAGQGLKKTSNGTNPKTSNTDKPEQGAVKTSDNKQDKSVMAGANKSKAKM